MNPSPRQKFAAEFLGTFFLVLAGTGAIVINDLSGGAVTHVGIAATFGLIVTTMIASLGDISGAHLNPAVTLGLWFAGKFPRAGIAAYIMFQCLGAVSASLILRLMFPTHPTLGATIPAGDWSTACVLEGLLTMLLMFVILNVTATVENKLPLIAVVIGAVIALEALFAGPICGASMNPARSLAPALVTLRFHELPIYVLSPIAGAFLGVAAFWCVRPSDCCSSIRKEPV